MRISTLDDAQALEIGRGPTSTNLLIYGFSSFVLHEHMSGSYLDLVAAIIRSGLKYEGVEYLRSDGGQYWCCIGNLDPEAVRSLALKYRTSVEDALFTVEVPVRTDTLKTS